MSHRDQALVAALGIPVARVADAMAKSRQTVNRGVHAKEDYFKVGDLAQALGVWRASNPDLYTRARQSICDIYPDIAAAVMTAVQAASPGVFTTDIPGEYWLICGSFNAFRTDLPGCATELETICAAGISQITLFVNERDERSALRWEAKFGPERAKVIKCATVDLSMMPTTLLRIDLDDKMDLFGVSDSGFVPLSRAEARRMRDFVEEALLRHKNAD